MRCGLMIKDYLLECFQNFLQLYWIENVNKTTGLLRYFARQYQFKDNKSDSVLMLSHHSNTGCNWLHSKPVLMRIVLL